MKTLKSFHIIVVDRTKAKTIPFKDAVYKEELRNSAIEDIRKLNKIIEYKQKHCVDFLKDNKFVVDNSVAVANAQIDYIKEKFNITEEDLK